MFLSKEFMKYSHNQKIVIVYGTKDRIKTFLEANIQSIEEDREEIKNKIIQNF